MQVAQNVPNVSLKHATFHCKFLPFFWRGLIKRAEQKTWGLGLFGNHNKKSKLKRKITYLFEEKLLEKRKRKSEEKFYVLNF